MPITDSRSPKSYLMLFRNGGPETIEHLSPAQRQELTQQWNAWYDGLAAESKVKHGHPLKAQGRVISGPHGKTVVDGPYAEAQDAIAGYFYLTATDLDEATAIAQHCPGLPYGMTVEVRPLANMSPVLEGVCARPPQ